MQDYGTDQVRRRTISLSDTRVCPWSDPQTQEGQFNWKEIDDFIRTFQAVRQKSAFGVMNVSTGLGQYVTPKWVFEAGAAPLGRHGRGIAHRPADHPQDLG